MRKIINWAVKILNSFGLHLMRSYRIPKNNLNFLLIAVPAILYQKSKLYFVQIGASDGKTLDPLYPVIAKYEEKLEGICVEPLPDVFQDLKNTYYNYPQIQLENAAIGDTNTSEITIYKPIDDKKKMLSQKASINENLLRKNGYSEKNIEKISVKQISFSNLVKKYNISDIDLLVVDTEGSDAKVVSAVFQSGYYPLIIHYESLHLNKEEREYMRSLLMENNYFFTETEKDTLAFKKQNN